MDPEDYRVRIAEIADGISSVTDQLKSRLGKTLSATDGNVNLEEIEVSFAIALQAEAGILVTKSTASATFTIKLKLKRSGSP